MHGKEIVTSLQETSPFAPVPEKHSPEEWPVLKEARAGGEGRAAYLRRCFVLFFFLRTFFSPSFYINILKERGS